MSKMVKEIFIWLGIFIAGSLIVSFLIYPETYQSFKLNMENIGDKHSTENIIEKENVIIKTNNKNNFKEEYTLRIVKDGCYEIKGVEDVEVFRGLNLKEMSCKYSCGGNSQHPLNKINSGSIFENGIEYDFQNFQKLGKLYYHSYKCGGTKNRDLFCYCEK